MTLPPELGTGKTDRLRADGSLPQAEVGESGEGEVRGQLRRRWLRAGKGVARRLLGRDRSSWIREHLIEPARFLESSRQRVGQLEDESRQLLASLKVRGRELEEMASELHAATINLELLKGEVRSVVGDLDELGMAIAPAAGLAGAGARLSELRERVNGLDRRLRSVMSPAAPAAPGAQTGSGGDGKLAASSALFDYVGFERRFRGEPSLIAERMAERYLDRLAGCPPVVDVGCGNAGLVAMLTARGVKAIGIDTDPSMVAEAQAQGLDVRLVDGATFLSSQPPGSIGSIIATHVVEHLQLDQLVQLLELAASRLVPGGQLIAETPNPASLIVLGNSYILDPTHVRPLHPSLLTFLCEGAGFRDIRLQFYEPARDYQLPVIGDSEGLTGVEEINSAFAKLNQVLFGPQEYAVIATTPPTDCD
jgi:SAM-dependent methyltransferase